MQLGVFQHKIGNYITFCHWKWGQILPQFEWSDIPDGFVYVFLTLIPSLIVVSGGGVQGFPTGPGGQSGVPQSPRPQRPPSSGGVCQRVQLPPLVLHALIVCNPPKGKITQTILPLVLQKEHLEKC